MKGVPIHLDPQGEPLYIQIARAITQAIQEGRIAANTRLPSIRSLARELEVNPVTVVSAYRHLEQQGYAWSKPGSGTYSGSVQTTAPARQISVPADAINFASSTPTPDIFPVEDFRQHLNRILDRDGGHAFGYQESQGYFPLRESFAQYLLNLSIEADPRQIHIISGAQQGIDIAAKMLCAHGDTVVVEDPTYPGAMAAILSRGGRPLSVPLTPDGPDLVALEELFSRHRPRFFYCMPNYQNPTGCTWTVAIRQAVLELAHRHQVYIVEDDFLTELNFCHHQNTPLKALDTRGRVLYIKSFSKILMPGLRLGLLLSPADLVDAAGEAKHLSDISSSGLLQRAFDLYLREGAWQRHLQEMKAIYEQRYHELTRHISQLPLKFTPPGGGLHLWLGANQDCDALARRSLEKKLLLIPGSQFSPKFRDHFRLSFAAVHLGQIKEGIAILSDTLQTKPSNYSPLL